MPTLIQAYLVLCLLALVVSVDAQRESDMRFHQHRQSLPQHQHHQPILSGSLFPEPKTVKSRETHVACPYVCKDHGSGHFFAVTSVGEGFPRVQYTCSHPPTLVPTHPPSKDRNFGQHLAGVNPPNDVHSPADPTPEHIPSLIRHLLSDVNSCHPTPLSESITSSPSDYELGHRPRYGIYSPREQFMAEEIHTTTPTYSKDEHLQVRPIHSSDQGEMRSREQELHSGRFKTTPEPMIPAPTSASDRANARLASTASIQDHLSGKEQRAGPPQPTPEPTPGQVNTRVGGSQVHHASDRFTVRHYDHETKTGGHGVKTIVHRVTTIIMETETLIARPSPTLRNWVHHSNNKVEPHHNQHRLGEHVMFDAGEEGDLVVSIVSEHISHAKDKRKNRGKDQP
ncbi:hypothetical protein CPB97_003096 [Podila verticillata]|nr:hypothetical protein CPB97_003096 [Podila verticillata]